MSGYQVKTTLEPDPSQPSKIEDIAGGDILEDTTTVLDQSGDEVTIPGGFGVAEDSATDADDGIVITDGTNEFVWIPVPDSSTMYIEATNGIQLSGVTTKTYVYSNLRIRNGDNYTAGQPGNDSTTREPDILAITDNDERYYKDILGYNSLQEMADAIVKEYADMYNSAKKYKGFYVGRYELTGTVSIPTVQKGQTVLSAYSADNWYNLKKACNNIINNVHAQSGMIYGNQWDQIMSWLIDTGEKTDSEINVNSNEWGISSDSAKVSGSNELWKANNIYDLAGNYYEFTQEAYAGTLRMNRASSRTLNIPASRRYGNSPSGTNRRCNYKTGIIY